MPRFRYKAVDPGGEVTEGEIEAADRGAVIARLHALDQVPIRAEEVAGPAPSRRWWQGLRRPAASRLRPRGLAHFTRELASLTAAGLAVDRALVALQATGADRGLTPIVGRVLERVRGGMALSAALEGLSPLIGGFYLAMVRAGEMGGSLDRSLERLAEYLDRAAELADRVASALLYPLILLVATGLSLAVLFVFVVPQFEQMFRDAHHALPLATRLLVAISHLLRDWGVALLLALLAALLWLRWRLKDPAVRARLDALVLRLPVAGRLVAALATERTARALGTLLAGGVALPRALELARGVAGNAVLAAALGEAGEAVTQGRRLSAALADSGRFAPVTVELVRVGEETGRLADLLLRAAEAEGRAAKATIDRLVALMVPALTLLLGLIVGAVVIAVLSAVVGLYDLVL